MKKIGLLFLAVLMVLGMAGCSDVLETDQDPVGTWVVNYDWGCDGSVGVMTWRIYVGGSYNDNQGGSGTWKVVETNITLSYDNGTNYGGKIDGAGMNGTMTSVGSGTQGCWNASRISTKP